MEGMMNNENFLGTAQVARLLDVSRDTVARWALNGSLPATKHPSTGHYLIRREDVERLQSTSGGGRRVMPPPESSRRLVEAEIAAENRAIAVCDTRSARAQSAHDASEAQSLLALLRCSSTTRP